MENYLKHAIWWLWIHAINNIAPSKLTPMIYLLNYSTGILFSQAITSCTITTWSGMKSSWENNSQFLTQIIACFILHIIRYDDCTSPWRWIRFGSPLNLPTFVLLTSGEYKFLPFFILAACTEEFCSTLLQWFHAQLQVCECSLYNSAPFFL
jgi:hypothetical protein